MTILKLCALGAALSIAYAPAGAQPPASSKVSAQVADAAGKKLNALADEYYDAMAKFDPVSASESGDNRFSDQLGMSIAPAVRAKQFALYRTYLKRLQAISPMQLVQRDRTSYDILNYELAMALRFEAFPEHLLPINQMDSLPVTLANYASGEGSQPLTTANSASPTRSRRQPSSSHAAPPSTTRLGRNRTIGRSPSSARVPSAIQALRSASEGRCATLSG